MPRPPKINEAELLELLKTGITNQLAADKLDVSREAIRLRRVDLEKRDLLPPRAGLVIVKRGKGLKAHKKVTVVSPKAQPILRREPTLDEIDEYIIQIREQAAETRSLKNRLAATENELIFKNAELERVTKYYQDRLEKKRRFELAQTQGELP